MYFGFVVFWGWFCLFQNMMGTNHVNKYFFQQTIVPRSLVNVVATLAPETILLSWHIIIYIHILYICQMLFFGCRQISLQTKKHLKQRWDFVGLDLFRQTKERSWWDLHLFDTPLLGHWHMLSHLMVTGSAWNIQSGSVGSPRDGVTW